MYCAGINNSTKRTDSICSIDNITAHLTILHDTACHHDNILGSVGQLFDDQVYHLAQASVFVLEQFGDTKEQRSGFVGGESFAREEQQGNFGQENSTSSRRYGRGIE